VDCLERPRNWSLPLIGRGAALLTQRPVRRHPARVPAKYGASSDHYQQSAREPSPPVMKISKAACPSAGNPVQSAPLDARQSESKLDRADAGPLNPVHPCASLLIPAYLRSKPCLIGLRQEAGMQGLVEGSGSRPIKAARRRLAEQTAGSCRLGLQLWSVPVQRFQRTQTPAIGSVCTGPTDLRLQSRDSSVFTESLY
jgi:hypothetical protein